MSGSHRISGFVIAYNRASLLATCLRSLRFVDELIVIDKPSTDDTPCIARRYADRVITVPWSPTVEETRSFALDQCRHEWIAFLDDDEMLTPEAIAYLHAPRASDGAVAVALPLRHWILGAFDANAYYWPEFHFRFLRRGAIEFRPVVHGGTNRYTSRPRRVGAEFEMTDMIDFAHKRIDHWMALSRDSNRNDYQAAVALLRAIYDMLDRVKAWEARRGLDGAGKLRTRCEELDRAYDELEMRHGIATGMRRGQHAAGGMLQRLIGRMR